MARHRCSFVFDSEAMRLLEQFIAADQREFLLESEDLLSIMIFSQSDREKVPDLLERMRVAGAWYESNNGKWQVFSVARKNDEGKIYIAGWGRVKR